MHACILKISQHEQPRDEIAECVKEAEKDPERKIRTLSHLKEYIGYSGLFSKHGVHPRKHPYKKGVLRYYCETKIGGHKRYINLQNSAYVSTYLIRNPII